MGVALLRMNSQVRIGRARPHGTSSIVIRSFLLLLMALWCVHLIAQDAALAPGDGQLWVGAEVEWKPAKRWRLSTSYILRTLGAFQAVKGGYSYLTARRRLNDHLYVDGKLRYVSTYERDHFRVEVGLRIQQRFGKDVLAFRTAYFREHEPIHWFSEGPQVADNYWRNRIRYMKDLPARYSAFASVESWTRFRYDGIRLRRAAVMTGLQRDLKKGKELSVTYLYQPEFNQRQPTSMNAVILGMAWDVSRRKKKGKRPSGEKSGADQGVDG